MDKDIYTNLSGEFSKKLNNGSCTLITGSKGSGKSCFALGVLRYCLENDVYQVYHLVIPNYETEINGSYKWIDKLWKEKKKLGVQVYIYSDYFPVISERIANRKNHTSCFLMLDDSTSMSLFYLYRDEGLKKCIINARHYKLSIFFIVHSVKGILSGLIRDNLNFVCILDIASRKLLCDMYEMWFSMVMTQQEFLNMYMEHSKRERGIIMLSTAKEKKVDLNPLDWKWVKDSIQHNIKCEIKH